MSPDESSGFYRELSPETIQVLGLRGERWRKTGICVLDNCSGVEISNGKEFLVVARESFLKTEK